VLPGRAVVSVVEEAKRRIEAALASGELVRPPKTTYDFAGTYQSWARAWRRLRVVLPLALLATFIILYLHFRAVPASLMVFAGIFVAFAGGLIMMWLYAQPWFLNFSVFGTSMRELFRVHPVKLTIAVGVGFLALFGIASDDGVVITTYLNQSFRSKRVASIADIRRAVIEGARRRIRPCLMTSATTILALIPVLTSSGRGADVMIPMAIPVFGGMCLVLMTVFLTPVLYSLGREIKFRIGPPPEADAPEPTGAK
jgi:Cu(I)/Ag(I) efflux system membrane protein CusA/SilA